MKIFTTFLTFTKLLQIIKNILNLILYTLSVINKKELLKKMEKSEKKYIESILKNYKQKEVSKLEELKNLDKSVRKPAKVFAYVFGSIGSLILGMGMCATMQTLPEVVLNAFSKEILVILGIGIGIIGIAMVSFNYYIYKAILKNRKNKYKNEIITLSDELLSE